MSMYPPIFEIASIDSGLTALIGTNPVRLWPFNDAPQNAILPYIVWQTIGGIPENYLTNVPDIDQFSIQIDVYGSSAATVRSIAEKLRDIIEPVAHVIAWRGESVDFETKSYRFSFDVDWFVNR